MWPFSTIRRLENACDSHFQFSMTCLKYLDQVHPPWKHQRGINGDLLLIGEDSINRIETGQAGVYEILDTDYEKAKEWRIRAIGEPSTIETKPGIS